jgi:hypothetical protein
MDTRQPTWLLFVCIVLLVSHVAVGHAHADVLAAVPVEDHVPGDHHHQSAGGSCDGVKAPADGTPVPAAPSFISPCITFSPCRAALVGTDPAVDRPPLFLLHASLLI